MDEIVKSKLAGKNYGQPPKDFVQNLDQMLDKEKTVYFFPFGLIRRLLLLLFIGILLFPILFQHQSIQTSIKKDAPISTNELANKKSNIVIDSNKKIASNNELKKETSLTSIHKKEREVGVVEREKMVASNQKNRDEREKAGNTEKVSHKKSPLNSENQVNSSKYQETNDNKKEGNSNVVTIHKEENLPHQNSLENKNTNNNPEIFSSHLDSLKVNKKVPSKEKGKNGFVSSDKRNKNNERENHEKTANKDSLINHSDGQNSSDSLSLSSRSKDSLPQKEATKNFHIVVQIGAGINYGFPHKSSPYSSQNIEKLSDDRENVISPMLEVRTNFYLKQILLGVGVGYYQIIEDNDFQLTTIPNHEEVDVNQRYAWMSIPLYTGYQFNLKKGWSIIPQIGGQLNLNTRSETVKYPTKDYSILQKVAPKKWNLDIFGGIKFSKKMNHWGIFIQTEYHYGITPIISTSPYKFGYSNLGVTIGGTYQF